MLFLQFLDQCEVIPVVDEEADLTGAILAGLIRSGHPIGPLDPFIASTAIQRELPLVTNNIGRYQRIVDLAFPLELENWRSS